MEQLERPSEELWDERRLWFEELEARFARGGTTAASEQACALMIDLQAVFCAGAWAAAVILACAVTEAQGGSKRESLPGVPDSDVRWLRALRNRLSHENRNDPELTVEDQWQRRSLWEERARRAVAIAFASLYPGTGAVETRSGWKVKDAMKVGIKQLVEAAEREIETLPVAEALDLHGREDVCFVDLRDPRELDREGRIPGALHCPRGLLEFWIDPESPYHKPVFAEPKRFVFFCAMGWRSALATKTAADMGLEPVAHIGGGFTAWREAGGAVAPPREKP